MILELELALVVKARSWMWYVLKGSLHRRFRFGVGIQSVIFVCAG